MYSSCSISIQVFRGEQSHDPKLEGVGCTTGRKTDLLHLKSLAGQPKKKDFLSSGSAKSLLNICVLYHTLTKLVLHWHMVMPVGSVLIVTPSNCLFGFRVLKNITI